MYVDVPTNVSAMELISSPETPKSHILISPCELHRMLDGFISVHDFSKFQEMSHDAITSVDDSMNVVKVRQAFEHSERNSRYNVDFYCTNLLVNSIERALVHIFHANTDIWIREESSP